MAEISLFTSESVSEGHPDKMADQISDAILDALVAQDKASRVACETMIKTGMVIVAGEISSQAISMWKIRFGKSYVKSDIKTHTADSMEILVQFLMHWANSLETSRWELMRVTIMSKEPVTKA